MKRVVLALVLFLSITFMAACKPKTVTVHFDTDGGTSLIDQEVRKGDRINLPSTTKVGYYKSPTNPSDPPVFDVVNDYADFGSLKSSILSYPPLVGLQQSVQANNQTYTFRNWGASEELPPIGQQPHGELPDSYRACEHLYLVAQYQLT